MNTILKRVLSLILCFVMVVGYMPVNAFATENGETVTTETTSVTTEATGEPSEETEAPSESEETPAEQSVETDGSDEEVEKSEKELEKAEKEAEKAEKEAEKEAKKAEKEAEKEAKKEEKESKEETEPSTEATDPSTEATEPSTEATEPSTEATEPSTEATEPSTEATEPSVETNPDDLLMTLEIEDEADPVAAALEVRSGVTVSSDALTEAKAYIDGITINNSSNDPATVVGNFGTHFTWDNEKRESSKSYLFDWSYYNGVVFEGLEYLYEVTGDTQYKDYVVEYMSSLITSNGTWATCTNNSSKECAGYNSTHGADCYKTASLLLDAYEMTGDSRYLTMAATLYADLDSAANSYSLSNAGNNYRHTWASDPDPDLWLDGLYMILPFRAEYAKYIGDTEELNLIVSRMQWVSDNMYNESKGLFYHAADSATSNSGTYWLRSIGWYAAAIVDIMDSMSGDNLEAMKTQLKKLVDGMLLVQNTSNGMWLNNMNASQSSSNPYETSGTALVCYAVMKAVNEGWLDESYADMAILAFNGICSEKLSGSTLTDICFKGAPGSSNSTFYDNEGKGVGPFIMFYAEVEEYVNGVTAPETPEPSEPTEPEDETREDPTTGVTVTAPGITGLTVTEIQETEQVEQIQQKVSEVLNTENLVMLDIAVADFTTGSTATVVVPIPDGMDSTKFAVYYVPEEGDPELMPGKALSETQYEFTTTHFSVYVGGEVMPIAEEPGTGTNYGEGNLVGSATYTLDTNGVTANKNYLIVNTGNNGTGYALTNNNGNAGRTEVTVSNGTITVEDDSNIAWVFSGSTSGTVGNNGHYVYPNQNSLSLNANGTNLTISNQNNGAYRLYCSQRSGGSGGGTTYYYYLRYNNGNWTGSRTNQQNNVGSVYLYEYTSSSAGEEVTFTVTPGNATIAPDGTVALTGTVTVAGETVDLSDCTITWASANEDVATVSNGTVTGKTDGTANITATLSVVDGTALQDDIVLTVPVTVQSKAISSITLDPASGTVYVGSGDAALTGGKVKITYDDGTVQNVNITVDMLIGEFTTATKGTYSGLKVTYNGTEVNGTFTLNVVEAPDMNYPEYPDPGSVDLDKYIADYSQFQKTGVAEVNLTTSGLPAQVGVDVILVADISNSMAWFVNAGANGEDTDAEKIATGSQSDKWDALQESASTFIDVFMSDNADGAANTNTVTFVTFGGYDSERNTNSSSYTAYADSVQTHFVGSANATAAKATINGIEITGNTSDSSYTISGMASGNGTAQGGTNYDFAFAETYDAILALKAQYKDTYGIDYEVSGREIYVLFMTDGAPDHYNQLYYKNRSNTQFDYYAQYLNSSDIDNGLTKYLTGAPTITGFNGEFYQRVENGYYLPESNFEQNQWENWITSDSNAIAEKVLAVDEVKSITSIGFDIAYGGFGGWTLDQTTLTSVLKNLAGTGSCDVKLATSTDELNAFYTSMASELKMAATNAYYIDQMGDNFNIQMASSVTKFEGTEDETTETLTPRPKITISTQAIYTPDDVGSVIGGVTVTSDMIGDTYGDKTILETVTFNDAGTEAYSDIDVDGDGDTSENIIDANGVIVAENFWYNTSKTAQTIVLADSSTYSLPAETFYWNIGTINNQKFIMSYYVYLDGSAEGDKEAGTYATNNKATLYYENWLGNDAWQDVDSPALSWESAAVYYGFYLVDEDGNPVVNRATGQTGDIEDAVKVTSKIFYREILLNDVTEVTTISVESTAVPDGYIVYDKDASYTITIDSAQKVSGWTIVNGTTPDTTYVTDYRGNEYSNITDSDDLASQTGVDYTATTVWFAVVWEPSTVPDVVVIDYGLPVDINVLENDMFGTAGSLVGVGALDKKPVADVNAYKTSDSAEFTSEYKSTYGTATLNGREVRYTPTTMEMPTYDKFSYEVLYNNETEEAMEYYYGDVTVIPATTIYYEDSFLKLGNGNSAGWSSAAEESDATQAEDRPGYYSLSYMDANNIYGYDGAYTNCSTHSLDNAAKVHLETNQYATAEFTFYGTGFDVISVTSDETGVLAVQVSAGSTFDAEVLERDTLVNTYYGMNADGSVSLNTPDALYQVPVMKIENLPYGQYTARITATYVGFFDKTEADGYDLYLDAIRIYDPANDGAADGTDDTTIEDAYVADGEGWPTYMELRNNIISAADVTVETGDDGNPKVTNVSSENSTIGAMFIDCADGNTSIEDYVSYGPNNELYLAENQAVAFSLGIDEAAWNNVADVQIGLKVANGDSVNYKIYDANTSTEADATIKTLNTATDMYYSIKSQAAGSVVIKNVEGGILSITNIKVTYKSDPNGAAVAMAMTEEDAGIVLMSLRPAVVEEPEIPETTEPEESVPETTVPEETVPEESVPETTVPEETEPETTVPETTVPEETEDQREQVEEAVKEAVKAVVNTVKNVLQNLFSKWFR